MTLGDVVLESAGEVYQPRVQYLVPRGLESFMEILGSHSEPVIVDGKGRLLEIMGWVRRNK